MWKKIIIAVGAVATLAAVVPAQAHERDNSRLVISLGAFFPVQTYQPVRVEHRDYRYERYERYEHRPRYYRHDHGRRGWERHDRDYDRDWR